MDLPAVFSDVNIVCLQNSQYLRTKITCSPKLSQSSGHNVISEITIVSEQTKCQPCGRHHSQASHLNPNASTFVERHSSVTLVGPFGSAPPVPQCNPPAIRGQHAPRDVIATAAHIRSRDHHAHPAIGLRCNPGERRNSGSSGRLVRQSSIALVLSLTVRC